MKQILKQLVRTAGPRLGRSKTARDIFYLIAQDFTPCVTASVGKYRYQVSTADRTVGREVFLTGGFDAPCIEEIFAVLGGLGFADFQGKLFLDIGANIGTTSVPVVMERGFSSGVAIEPEPTNFALLRSNVAANGMEERIRCINLALSDRAGHAEMELCPVNMGDHRLRSHDGTAGDGIYQEMSRATVRVPTATFDSLAKNKSIPLDKLGLVWIDTQGHEGHVLQGARTSSAPVFPSSWNTGPTLWSAQGG